MRELEELFWKTAFLPLDIGLSFGLKIVGKYLDRTLWGDDW